MTTRASLVMLACSLALSSAYLLDAPSVCLAQQGPPNAPQEPGPPTEPTLIHPRRPPPPPDFRGPQQNATPRKHYDPVRTSQDAQKLSALAAQIPGEVAEVSKGTLPKDLNQQLREIRKLAKRLQSEIAP